MHSLTISRARSTACGTNLTMCVARLNFGEQLADAAATTSSLHLGDFFAQLVYVESLQPSIQDSTGTDDSSTLQIPRPPLLSLSTPPFPRSTVSRPLDILDARRRSTSRTCAPSSASTPGSQRRSGAPSGRCSRAPAVSCRSRSHDRSRSAFLVVLREEADVLTNLHPCAAVTAAILGGIVYFKNDFAEQYFDSQTFLPT